MSLYSHILLPVFVTQTGVCAPGAVLGPRGRQPTDGLVPPDSSSPRTVSPRSTQSTGAGGSLAFHCSSLPTAAQGGTLTRSRAPWMAPASELS